MTYEQIMVKIFNGELNIIVDKNAAGFAMNSKFMPQTYRLAQANRRSTGFVLMIGGAVFTFIIPFIAIPVLIAGFFVAGSCQGLAAKQVATVARFDEEFFTECIDNGTIEVSKVHAAEGGSL